MTANSLDSNVLDKVFEKGAAATPVLDRPDGGKEMLIPEGYKPHTIPPLDKILTRIRQSISVYDTASFTAYVNRYKGENTRLFATPGHLAADRKATVAAIIDYHAPDKADHGAHVARYQPRYSEQWTRWSAISAKPMMQQDFAEFVEENRADIRVPEAAMLLDIVSKFKATKKVEFDSVVYQPNGDVTIGWDEKTEHKGKAVTVPTELELGIPVFFKGTLYSVKTLMRYRLSEGKLTFTVKLDNPAIIEQAAFDEITKVIAEATGIEIYLGTAA